MLMIVECFNSNPAANSFDYVEVLLPRAMHVKQYFIQTETATFTGFIFIYRGSINAYAAANNAYAMLIERWLALQAGASYAYYGPANPSRTLEVYLPAGTYTFASYTTPDTTNLRWVFYLE